MDESLIPNWMFDSSVALDESSLLIHENLDCVIDRDIYVEDSFQQLRGNQSAVVPDLVRPLPHLEYIKVNLSLQDEN